MAIIKPEVSDDAEKLHNELVAIIIKRGFNLETIILLLDMIKYDLLKQANDKVFGVRLSDKIPTKIWSTRKFMESSSSRKDV